VLRQVSGGAAFPYLPDRIEGCTARPPRRMKSRRWLSSRNGSFFVNDSKGVPTTSGMRSAALLRHRIIPTVRESIRKYAPYNGGPNGIWQRGESVAASLRGNRFCNGLALCAVQTDRPQTMTARVGKPTNAPPCR
jgi:hypothetical protein